MNGPYFLSLLVFSPLLGILLLALTPKTQERTIKWLGFLSTLPSLILSLFAFCQYLRGYRLEHLTEKRGWVRFADFPFLTESTFVVRYELNIDGISLVMIVLTSLLAALAAVASIHIKKEWKGYFMLFLLLEIGMLGVFAAGNMVLFFIFLEMTLVAMFFLIGKWGGFERERAAYSYLLYNGVGSAVLLMVIAILFARAGTSNMELLKEMLHNPAVRAQLIAPISDDLRFSLFLALLIAFGIKLPIVPFHRWILRVHVQAPPAIVMLHSGVLLKIGAYGLIRFAIGLFPDQFRDFAFIIAILGVVNLLYGAFLAFIQNDFKMVLAYSSVSHMGIVLIGLGALNEAGMQGAIFQAVSHGLISALLFLLVSILFERTNTTEMDRLGGLAKAMPLTAGSLLAGALASLGLPGMSGFVSEFTAFFGLFQTAPAVAAAGTLGIIMTAVYLLRAVLNITFGTSKSGGAQAFDMSLTEAVPVFVLLALIIMIGVYPRILAEPLQAAIKMMMNGLGA
ncbi:NADH-quinone oxidoreductase subunit M [Parageobacillus thermoglucosidasius]|uniref:NADH-quinone oxidoreductase subunit M n=1 Tax=Parageobacillus thermoglucosidasius TaxID=1426 RepID=A0AAN0YLG3_PARTM|nr:NADH-quinone oxidoreductase subunit M [Parageobacillus thermoglucosidasius]ALF09234.1 NADH:ubiquinone oxidoreductase subunit M [Parageobacillus thermoglucosidasius]ANZ29317.1 NADH-quinone oxidoreductase subunit M [Parageobacillus thermoglucosidasius]APM80055.1 NADH-quinone oxidoreductase subunit M [Parageobacillus thermoglucosidasius]KJX69934.1 NADH:ubiquinone oxidoreductase subunit M [Parageobacillus thermoglucosidasius]MBY6266766.1 NADH-quinone oxidoreductase subunit M [Parageobacillus th